MTNVIWNKTWNCCYGIFYEGLTFANFHSWPKIVYLSYVMKWCAWQEISHDFNFVKRQVLIQLSQVGALLPPVSVKGSLFISSTLSSTNPTCKFQQKGFIRSNIEVFLCIYWHFILFPNAFCFEIGTKTWSVKLYKKWNMFFPSNLFKECSTYRKHK